MAASPMLLMSAGTAPFAPEPKWPSAAAADCRTPASESFNPRMSAGAASLAIADIRTGLPAA